MKSQPDWVCGLSALRNELAAWIEDSIVRQERVPYHGVHDEGSFTFSWDAYYFFTRDERVRRFLSWLRDGFAAWGDEHFYHGFYPEGEVHHQTEPFTHFIARFRTLDPQNDVAPRLLDHVAHHTGNWEPGVPPWYDWDRHALVSWKIGSRVVPTEPPHDYEEPDSIRPAMITLAAYAATKQQRYLDFCVDYGDKWARALLEEPYSRVAFWGSETGKYEDRLTGAHEDDLAYSAELITSSGMIDYLLDLHHLSGGDLYRQALERIMPLLVDVVADPRNAVSAGQLAKYRRLTGDPQFDADIVRRIRDAPPVECDGLAILDLRDDHQSRKAGLILNTHIGHRFDQVRWGCRDGSRRMIETTEPTPAAWSLTWQITGNTAYAAHAMNRAAERVRIGRQTLDDGRDHGCAGFTLGAVASGHGRADRYGDVNTVFGPLALGSVRLISAEEPLVICEEGVPESVASLVRFVPQPEVTWWNTGDTDAVVSWRDASNASASSCVTTIPAGGSKTVSLSSATPRLSIT